jgi:hypothetical protein
MHLRSTVAFFFTAGQSRSSHSPSPAPISSGWSPQTAGFLACKPKRSQAPGLFQFRILLPAIVGHRNPALDRQPRTALVSCFDVFGHRSICKGPGYNSAVFFNGGGGPPFRPPAQNWSDPRNRQAAARRPGYSDIETAGSLTFCHSSKPTAAAAISRTTQGQGLG